MLMEEELSTLAGDARDLVWNSFFDLNDLEDPARRFFTDQESILFYPLTVKSILEAC